MKHKTWLCCLVLKLATLPIFAQDQSNFTQFYLNPYLINPSYAGIDGQSAFSVIYKRQWMSIDEGPSIANVSLHTPVNARTGVGISITNDKKGILNNSGLLFSLSYNVPVASHSSLRFGLSAGGAWNTVDIDKLDTNDPATATIQDANASLSGNAGISFHHKVFNLGISMPTIFSPAYVSEDAFTITEVKPFQSIIVNSSYRFYFNNNKNIFEPYAVYRLNTSLPPQFEVAGVIHLNHMVWAGGSYKQDFGISALAGVKLQNMFAVGGSYTLKNSGDNELNSPSFEVSISYLFGKHKKGTHAYSFVNTVKEKEKKPLSAVAARLKQKELERKKQEAKARQDALLKKQQDAAAAAKAKNEPVKKDTTKVHVGRPRFNQEMIETVKTSEELHQEQEQEALKRLEVHSDNPTEHHGEDPAAHPHAERHEFVKRGDHQEELDVADYVIGGVFKSEPNAKHFADGLIKLGFKADYGHLTEKNLWYVYLIQTSDINLARKERDRVRKMKLLRDAWLLTVHH
jgi:type IX secretion system PorP/SprF family membrane protein